MAGEDNQDAVSDIKDAINPLQSTIEKIPDEVLIGELAGRIQNEPTSETSRIVRATQTQASFSGPIPPPAMLAEYDGVDKGLANRIVTMAEEQQSHRHTLETQSLLAAINSEKRGQHYALVVSLLIIAGSIWLISNGNELSGSILAGGTLTALAYIFITGRKKEEDSAPESEG